MLRRLPWWIPLVLALAPASAAAERAPLTTDEIIRRWADGPARYLMSQKEEDEVLSLKSVPELARFITEFWQRRDPSANTFENEYRRLYWQRVVEANRRFRDSTTPGWKTDRGKIFILLGEPEEIIVDEHPPIAYGIDHTKNPMGEEDPVMRGVERWTFRRRYSRTADPEFVVAFVRDESLDWKLTQNSTLLKPDYPGVSAIPTPGASSPQGDGYLSRPAQTAGRTADPASPLVAVRIQADIVAIVPSIPDTSLFANYDLGLELSVPSNTQAVLAFVDTQDFIPGFTAEPRFEFFRAKDGSTFVNIGALVSAKDLYGEASTGISSLRVYASLTPDDDPDHPRYASNESSPQSLRPLAGAGAGRDRGCLDGARPAAGTLPGRARHRGHADRPPRADAGGAGRPRLRALAPGALDDSSSPRPSRSTVGGSGVTARSSGVFRRAEEFAVYYEVYNVAMRGGHPRFDVAYRFYRDTKDGLVPIGDPIPFPKRTEGAQGWTFPLARWPAGRYRIEVAVTDSSGASISAQAPFTVVE